MNEWADNTTNKMSAETSPATGGTGPIVSTTSDSNAGTLTVLGKVKDGKLVKSWNHKTAVLSDRTLNAMTAIGITVIDDPAQYLF